MLVSGITYWLELPSVAGMLSRGVLPPLLRQVAMRFASDEGIVKANLDEADAEKWDEVERVMIADAVRALEWSCPCERCVDRRGEAPIEREAMHFSPDDLKPGTRKISETEYEQLQSLVIRSLSTKQVDAMSKLAHEQLSDEEAATIIEAERVNTLAGWSSFRRVARSFDPRHQGGHVRRRSVVPADYLGPGGRVRGRRRTPAAPPGGEDVRAEARG